MKKYIKSVICLAFASNIAMPIEQIIIDKDTKNDANVVSSVINSTSFSETSASSVIMPAEQTAVDKDLKNDTDIIFPIINNNQINKEEKIALSNVFHDLVFSFIDKFANNDVRTVANMEHSNCLEHAYSFFSVYMLTKSEVIVMLYILEKYLVSCVQRKNLNEVVSISTIFSVSVVAVLLALKLSIDCKIPLKVMAKGVNIEPKLLATNEATMLESIEYSVMPTPEEYARFEGLAGKSQEERMKDFYDYHATLISSAS
jgi:hypothetical protein